MVAEPLDRDDARSRAKAAYLDRARRFVTGTGSTAGTPAVRAGVVVTLAGLVPLYNGDYRVVRTRHHYDMARAATAPSSTSNAPGSGPRDERPRSPIDPGQVSQINGYSDTRWLGCVSGDGRRQPGPRRQGRVKVRLPWSPDGASAYESWARLATMMAGNNRGTWFVPDDERRGAGRLRRAATPTTRMWSGRCGTARTPLRRRWTPTTTSRRSSPATDIRISLDDTSGAETLTLSTPGGQQITLTDGGRSIRLEDANGNSMEMAPDGVTLSAPAGLTINAGTVSISSGIGTVDSGIWTYSGVVNSDVLITNTVVSSAYTPGMGNVW